MELTNLCAVVTSPRPLQPLTNQKVAARLGLTGFGVVDSTVFSMRIEQKGFRIIKATDA
jgi:hypothetical protein